MYIGLVLVLIFFYDINPILMNVYVAKNEPEKKFCPFYFGLNFNETTRDCSTIKWYKVNESYNGHKIQCIGRSPYIIKNNRIVYDCIPDFYKSLCDGIII